MPIESVPQGLSQGGLTSVLRPVGFAVTLPMRQPESGLSRV
jgi:hypothetical protein